MAEVRRFGTILLAILIGFALAGPFVGGATALSADPSTALAASMVAAATASAMMFIVRRARSPLVLDMLGLVTGVLALIESLFGQANNPLAVEPIAVYEFIAIAVVGFAVPWRPITHYAFVGAATLAALFGLIQVADTVERNAFAGALAFAVAVALASKPVLWRMRLELHRQMERTRALNAELSHLAHRDATTGLFTRVALADHLARLARRPRGTVGFAMVDIDDFKAINDSFGHQAGDETLHRVAATVLSSIRAGDLAFRYGGDEFLVLFDRADPAALGAAVERIRAAVERERLPNPGSPLGLVTVSIGIAFADLPADATVLRATISSADAQLYMVKRSGKNAVALTPAEAPLGPLPEHG
jgi:diguanylate cyclase (GGDEF)-like protein